MVERIACVCVCVYAVAYGESNAHSKIILWHKRCTAVRNTKCALRVHRMSTESLTTVEMNTSPSSTQVQDSIFFLFFFFVFFIETHSYKYSTCTAFFMLFIVDVVVFHALLNTKWIFPFTFFRLPPLLLLLLLPLRIHVVVCSHISALLTCLHNRAIIFWVKVLVSCIFFTQCRPAACGNEYISFTRRTTGTSLCRKADGSSSPSLSHSLIYKFPWYFFYLPISRFVADEHQTHLEWLSFSHHQNWIVPHLMGDRFANFYPNGSSVLYSGTILQMPIFNSVIESRCVSE